MPKCVADEFVRYCGRIFTPEDIQCIRELITSEPRPNRTELSRQVCRALGWLRLNGSLKDMSCRVAMLRMEKDRLIELPPSRRCVKNPSKRPRLSEASDPQQPIIAPVALLAPLQLHSVNTPKASRLWNELIERYHYTPVLLETFVEQKRFQGTCYKAANWIHVGHTQGRGKLDRHHKHEKPVKDIYAYPLDRKFRQILCTDE